MAYNFSSFKQSIKDVEERLKKEYSGIRTGRATPAILDSILVESYGAKMPINQLGSIASEGPRSLKITPWEISQAKAIEKAILTSDLGLSASADDKGVRVIFPELTSERRASLIKIVKQKLEDARVSLRNERDKVWNDIQSKEKDGGMGEDEKFRLKNEMQKMVDDGNKSLEDVASRKETEILS
jgi:ribosome recycling factor